MKKTIVFDLDGVLVDCHSALEEMVHDKYPEFSVKRILTYDFNKSLDMLKAPYWFLTSREYTPIGKEFYGLNADRSELLNLLSDLRLFENADFFNGVTNMLPLLAKHYNIVFHSFAYTREIANYKSEMIDFHFKDKFAYTMITSIGTKKPCILNADFVVEDNLFDLEGYIGSDAKLLLVDRPYNQELFNPSLSSVFENSVRFKNITEVFKYLLNLLDLYEEDK